MAESAERKGLCRAGLRPKQRRFVEEYLLDLNASAAAVRAGYSPDPLSAGNIGRLLLKDPRVKLAVDQAIQERSERTGIKQDDVLREIGRIAFSDARKLVHPDGSLIPLQDLDEDTARAVASVKVKVLKTREGLVLPEAILEYKFWDKNSALEKAGKHLRLFGDVIENQVNTLHITINKGGRPDASELLT
jgi:phage terminase small subunit